MWAGEPAESFITRAERYVPTVRRLARREFDAQRRLINQRAENAHDDASLLSIVRGVLEDTEPRLLRFYRQAYAIVGEPFAKEGLPPGERGNTRRVEDEGGAWGSWTSGWWASWSAKKKRPSWWDAWLSETIHYAETAGGQNIRRINDRTLRRVQRQIMQGLERGEGISDIVRRVDRLYLDSIIPNRSEVIARTETLTAARAGAHHATLKAGYADRVVKSWMSTGDDRTRDTHMEADANNTDIPYTEPFLVRHPTTGTIERLMFPGDTSLGASAANVVQCRCDARKRLPK